MTFGGLVVRGGCLSVGTPRTHSMSSLSLARHGIVGHVHWSNHCGTVVMHFCFCFLK